MDPRMKYPIDPPMEQPLPSPGMTALLPKEWNLPSPMTVNRHGRPIYLHLRADGRMSIEIRFPSALCAENYRSFIRNTKPLVEGCDGGNVVAVEMPRRVVDIESCMEGFVLRFVNMELAQSWADPICRPVAFEPECLLLNQAWLDDEVLHHPIAFIRSEPRRKCTAGEPMIEFPPGLGQLTDHH